MENPRNVQQAGQEAADHRTDQADDRIPQAAVALAANNRTGKPAGQRSDNQTA